MPAFRAWLVEFPYTVTVGGDECKSSQVVERTGQGLLFSNGGRRVLFLRERYPAGKGMFFTIDGEENDGTPVLPWTRDEYDKPQGPLALIREVKFPEETMRVAFEATMRLKKIGDAVDVCVARLRW